MGSMLGTTPIKIIATRSAILGGVTLIARQNILSWPLENTVGNHLRWHFLFCLHSNSALLPGCLGLYSDGQNKPTSDFQISEGKMFIALNNPVRQFCHCCFFSTGKIGFILIESTTCHTGSTHLDWSSFGNKIFQHLR